jgi:hypothetical protein
MLAVLVYIFVKAATFDYSKVRPHVQAFDADREAADRIDSRRATEAAISDFTIKLFIARCDNPRLGVFLNYVPAEWISGTYLRDDDSPYPSLPKDKPALSVFFDSQTGGAIPEHAMAGVMLDPETSKVYGASADYGWGS